MLTEIGRMLDEETALRARVKEGRQSGQIA